MIGLVVFVFQLCIEFLGELSCIVLGVMVMTRCITMQVLVRFERVMRTFVHRLFVISAHEFFTSYHVMCSGRRVL